MCGCRLTAAFHGMVLCHGWTWAQTHLWWAVYPGCVGRRLIQGGQCALDGRGTGSPVVGSVPWTGMAQAHLWQAMCPGWMAVELVQLPGAVFKPCCQSEVGVCHLLGFLQEEVFHCSGPLWIVFGSDCLIT